MSQADCPGESVHTGTILLCVDMNHYGVTMTLSEALAWPSSDVFNCKLIVTGVFVVTVGAVQLLVTVFVELRAFVDV